MSTLEVRGLRAAVADKEILKGIDLGDAAFATDGDADVGGSPRALDDPFAL